MRYIFGNPGTTELPLMDAFIETPDISYIWALQEASVVAMAMPTLKQWAGQADIGYWRASMSAFDGVAK